MSPCEGGSASVSRSLDVAPLPLSRLLQATYRGGQMFYTRDESRRAFQEDTKWLCGAEVDRGSIRDG